jgi:ATP-dependent DNA helicase RecQ
MARVDAPPARVSLLRARAALRRHFGHPDFRPAQGRVIEAVFAGRDVLAVMPTGGGKSVCFQIPALLRPGLTVVLSPLIALMQDQVEAARARGLPAGLLNSTLTAEARRAVLGAVGAGDIRILYAAPERLQRLVVELGDLGAWPSLLVVDEAHCISEWGHDFRPAYRTIGRARAALGWPQAIAVTGSATRDVRTDIIETVGLGRSHAPRPSRGLAKLVASFDRPNLRFGVLSARTNRDRLLALVPRLRREPGCGIVYVPTRNLSEAVARVLRESGVRAFPYHAGLTKERRSATLERFLSNDARVVVATCAFGMGIDKPDVRFVLHWAMPATPESYYQEAGRSGRDGLTSQCVMLFCPGDLAHHRRLLEVTFPPERLVERAWADSAVLARLPESVRESVERLRAELKPERGQVWWKRVRRRRRLAEARLRALEHYARGTECRRRVLLRWFGERVLRCSGCDVCD